MIFLDKLGGLIKGIGSLLIETSKSLKAMSGEEVKVSGNVSGNKADLKDKV